MLRGEGTWRRLKAWCFNSIPLRAPALSCSFYRGPMSLMQIIRADMLMLLTWLLLERHFGELCEAIPSASRLSSSNSRKRKLTWSVRSAAR
jgi:hypothetical protein